jgi:hypothetical protein
MTAHKILRALGQMRSANPTLPIDTRRIREYARRAVADAARYATLRDALAAARPAETNASALISELLHEESGAAIEHAFRALGILRPRAGLRSAHDALLGDDDARRGAALEILVACAPSELRQPLLALLEPTTPEDRRVRLGALAAGPFETHARVLEALLIDPSESVRCIAAYHVAEYHLVHVRPELVRLRATEAPPLVHDAFDEAIRRLDARG